MRGLRTLGVDVAVRPLRVRTRFHTLDRWLYNAGVALRPPEADVVVGVDLDGFLWARHRRRRGARDAGRRYVVALKGIIADELTHERGHVRRLLAIQAGWERTNARRADRIVVPSRYSAAVARRVYGITTDAMTVIPEPIDVQAWQSRIAAAPRVPSRPPTVLCVARMYPRKHVADLLEAATLLRVRIPEARVRVVGKGPEFVRIEKLHARLGLTGTVDLLGEVSSDALAVEYANADCFCLPTVQEAFGVAFAEAMAAGVPVVACRAAAVPEVVEDGCTGLLVAARRPDELAHAIATVLDNHDLRTEMGMAAAKRVQAFDVDRVSREWLTVLGS